MQVRPSSPSGTAILSLLATIRYCWAAPLGCPMHTMQGWALDESGFSSNDEMLVPGCNTKRLKYYISKPALEETTTQHQEVQWTVMQPKSHKTQTYLQSPWGRKWLISHCSDSIQPLVLMQLVEEDAWAPEVLWSKACLHENIRFQIRYLPLPKVKSAWTIKLASVIIHCIKVISACSPHLPECDPTYHHCCSRWLKDFPDPQTSPTQQPSLA